MHKIHWNQTSPNVFFLLSTKLQQNNNNKSQVLIDHEFQSSIFNWSSIETHWQKIIYISSHVVESFFSRSVSKPVDLLKCSEECYVFFE